MSDYISAVLKLLNKGFRVFAEFGLYYLWRFHCFMLLIRLIHMLKRWWPSARHALHFGGQLPESRRLSLRCLPRSPIMHLWLYRKTTCNLCGFKYHYAPSWTFICTCRCCMVENNSHLPLLDICNRGPSMAVSHKMLVVGNLPLIQCLLPRRYLNDVSVAVCVVVLWQVVEPLWEWEAMRGRPHMMQLLFLMVSPRWRMQGRRPCHEQVIHRFQIII